MFSVSSVIPYMTSIRREYTGSTGPIQICNANPNRSVLYVSGTAGSNLFIDFNNNATSNHYARILIGGGTIALYWAIDGLFVTLPWYWYPSGAGSPLTVAELIWTPPVTPKSDWISGSGS